MSEQLSPQNESSPDILGDILGKILGSQTQSTGEIATSESVPSGAGAGTSASNSQNHKYPRFCNAKPGISFI